MVMMHKTIDWLQTKPKSGNEHNYWQTTKKCPQLQITNKTMYRLQTKQKTK